MSFSDETLMAYADDELDPRTRAAVDAAMATDPEIARRVEQHKALRAKLRSAFDKVLDEPVPDRLVATARTSPAMRREGNVVPLRRKPVRRAWSSSAQWGAIAASLVIGALLGQAWVRSSATGPILTRNGELRASGTLERALSGQLASNQPAKAPVQIGLSFRAKSGDYCRTFSLNEGGSLAGLACRDDDGWRVRVLAQRAPENNTDRYRQAASSMPHSVLQAVDEEMAGEPLDAQAEAAARNRGWAR
jgi:hypothetical protein